MDFELYLNGYKNIIDSIKELNVKEPEKEIKELEEQIAQNEAKLQEWENNGNRTDFENYAEPINAEIRKAAAQIKELEENKEEIKKQREENVKKVEEKKINLKTVRENAEKEHKKELEKLKLEREKLRGNKEVIEQKRAIDEKKQQVEDLLKNPSQENLKAVLALKDEIGKLQIEFMKTSQNLRKQINEINQNINIEDKKYEKLTQSFDGMDEEIGTKEIEQEETKNTKTTTKGQEGVKEEAKPAEEKSMYEEEPKPDSPGKTDIEPEQTTEIPGPIYEGTTNENNPNSFFNIDFEEGNESGEPEQVPKETDNIDRKIEFITITNKTVETKDKEDNTEIQKRGESVATFETKEEFLKAYEKEEIAEYYDAETLWEVYTDGKADLEILSAIKDVNMTQVIAYLNALGYENKKDYEPDLKQNIPLITYDLRDKKETTFRERLENYREAMKTKELLEKAGLDEHVEIDTRFFDRIAFGAIDLWERVTNNKQQKALPKPEPEHTTTEPNDQNSKPTEKETNEHETEQNDIDKIVEKIMAGSRGREGEIKKLGMDKVADEIVKSAMGKNQTKTDNSETFRNTVKVVGAKEQTDRVAKEFNENEGQPENQDEGR